MKIIKGDLIEMALNGEFDVIIHGCNCFLSMGKGIAAQIKFSFPEAYKADMETSRADAKKLGYFSHALIRRPACEFTVVNAYTQYGYKSSQGDHKVNYMAIESVMRRIKRTFTGKRIGYPKIGAGLAKGNWNRISKIIDKELEGEVHTLVVL